MTTDQENYGPDLPSCGSRWKVREVNGMKAYGCCECDETIMAGAKHQCCSGKWGEVWYTFRTCLRCVRRRAAVQEVCGSLPFWGMLREFVAVAPPDVQVEAVYIAGKDGDLWK